MHTYLQDDRLSSVLQYNHVPIARFHQTVLDTAHRWKMFPERAAVGIAVSGGADSVALFRTLHFLGESLGWRLVVLHVNHKLRGSESDEDARFVQELAGKMGLFCQSVDLPLMGGQNLEQEARILRRKFFKSCTILHNLHNVALGHTQSDQAETVLFRFLRGSGAAGLAGIHPVTRDGFVRPLLDVARDEVRGYLTEIGQDWREDSSNRSHSFDRNRIRLDLLPKLTQEWNPAIQNNLAQTAEWALGEEEYWDGILPPLVCDHLQILPGPAVIAKNEAISALPIAAARRLIRHAIKLIRGNLLSIDFAHVERTRALFTQTEGSGRLQLPGVDIMRSFEWVRFALPGSYGGDRHFSIPVQAPSEILLGESGSSLVLQIEEPDCLYNKDVNCLDKDRVAGPLHLRTWQPGDRFRPLGYPSDVRLKTLFQDTRVPLWERRVWPVLVAGESIVWTRRFGVAADSAVTPQTRQVIRITERTSVAEIQNENQVPDVERL